MASDLPVSVAEAGLLVQRASILGGLEAMQRIIAWGHEQIDVAYPESPLKAPVNLVRRIQPHQGSDKVVRTAGKELRGTIVSSAVRALEFEIARRQEAVLFDAQVRASEHQAISEINFTYTAKGMKLGHDLNQEAEDNALKRRIAEETSKVESQITVVLFKAELAARGTSHSAKTIETINDISAEILEIRKEPGLTDDDKRLPPRALHGRHHGRRLPRTAAGCPPGRTDPGGTSRSAGRRSGYQPAGRSTGTSPSPRP